VGSDVSGVVVRVGGRGDPVEAGRRGWWRTACRWKLEDARRARRHPARPANSAFWGFSRPLRWPGRTRPGQGQTSLMPKPRHLTLGGRRALSGAGPTRPPYRQLVFPSRRPAEAGRQRCSSGALSGGPRFVPPTQVWLSTAARSRCAWCRHPQEGRTVPGPWGATHVPSTRAARETSSSWRDEHTPDPSEWRAVSAS